MLLPILEFCVLVILFVIFFTQILLPLLDGRKLFPMFVKNVKTLDKVELELNQLKYESNRAEQLEKEKKNNNVT